MKTSSSFFFAKEVRSQTSRKFQKELNQSQDNSELLDKVVYNQLKRVSIARLVSCCFLNT